MNVWKLNFPLNPYVRLMVVCSVCMLVEHSEEDTLPTCWYLKWIFNFVIAKQGCSSNQTRCSYRPFSYKGKFLKSSFFFNLQTAIAATAAIHHSHHDRCKSSVKHKIIQSLQLPSRLLNYKLQPSLGEEGVAKYCKFSGKNTIFVELPDSMYKHREESELWTVLQL